ncbi:hypothetical protein GPECTOR_167g168 [Gonium pectorale]|uniref:Protein kinase domain-containing protein n=1 Tax=Gonium pectorale TaxID=33097 RepID=A0A150FXI3_GONPE|nr:hypothetical protein GPECTOR_167g168 [Gonium pectorale]|eukprot:KXZ42287.1 hypothetical protein GPECTOR_167g168 [Gonium pectorale]
MRGDSPFGVKADCFSVGVLMAVCAVWHKSEADVYRFLDRQKKLPKCVPAELRHFILTLTAADPAKRPSAQQALAHPFLAGMRLEELV